MRGKYSINLILQSMVLIYYYIFLLFGEECGGGGAFSTDSKMYVLLDSFKMILVFNSGLPNALSTRLLTVCCKTSLMGPIF